ncbi:zinc finger protein 436 isoform X1 [Entelurus aequoreus]|uniref:zinc finger protein 436 isoform X1 n=1 Tax=Entelurus aequoreus TaxID=161455 RepID=UPI002B1E0091|nr:zinc finger protein 436 isoform X1 [Entelurus aequoreus]
MADPLVTFQSQLSGVMETVFKAAMYEITRLVQDSFVEEVARCREQVERLKRRLKWSESKRKEPQGDRGLKCADFSALQVPNKEKPKVMQIEKNLKQESELQEDMQSQEDAAGHPSRMEEEVCVDMKVSQSSNVPNLDRLLKEEALRITPEAKDSEDVDESETSVLPGPSKHSHINWEASFDQTLDSSQSVHLETPLEGRYMMDDFRKTNYGDTSMDDVASLELQGSSQPGADMTYTSHYEGDRDAPEEAKEQTFQTGELIYGGGSRADTDLRELSCLLINEDGYIQNQSLMHASSSSSQRLSYQDQGDTSLVSTGDLYGSSKAFPACDNAHFKAERGARGRFCNQRSLSFPHSAAHNAHKQTHGGSAPPCSCEHCKKAVTPACNLDVSQRIHSRQELHHCSRCGKSFSLFSDLKTHKCSQCGDKRYCCGVCGNKFSRLWNLKLHQRIHTQEKPHQCTTCHKSFTRADILKVHQRTHTGERPYCCTVCGLSFKRLDHLRSHQRKHLTHL